HDGKKERETGYNRGEAWTHYGLSTLEEKNGDLSEIEVDEVLRLMGHVTAEVAADDAMPGWVVLLVEFLLDVGSDVLLDVVLLKCLGGTINRVLLHVFAHVGVLDHGFAVSHLE
ncbi:hypothetical protein PMAYCL1PPCAC_12257, partial [Pristionchus mayeri]